jgi:hypothetical protein
MRGPDDVDHAWFNLKEDVPDLQFAEAARAYLEHLKEDGQLVAYRIARCKLGLAPPNLREWHITLDFLGLGQSLKPSRPCLSEPTQSSHFTKR